MALELREVSETIEESSPPSFNTSPKEEWPSSIEDSEAPPNGGFNAWLQVFSASFLVFNSWGIVNSFGAYQAFYESDLLSSTSSSTISWIGTTQAFLLVLAGVITGPVYDRGHARLLVGAGTFLIFLGMLMTSFSTEYPQLFLAQGVLVGLGFGCLYVPSVATVASYFSTRRALAVGLTSTGGSISGVIYVIAFRRLQPRIGFGWATRIIAFIALMTLMANLVLTKTRTKPGPTRALLDPKAFRSAPYTLFTAGSTILLIGLYFPYFYIPVYSERIVGTSADFAFYLLAVINAASFFGRIVPSILADKVGPLNVLIPCIFITAALSLAWVWITSVSGIVAFTILYGFFSGTILSLMPTVIASLSPDPGSYGTRMGMSFGIGSFGVLIGNPIAGKLLNAAEGEFSNAQYFAASTMFAGAVLLLVARLLIGWDDKGKREILKARLRSWPLLKSNRLLGGVPRDHPLRSE